MGVWTTWLLVGTFLMLLVLSFAEPAVSHKIADLGKVPTELKLDWYYLWAYPMIEELGPGFMWGFAFVGTLLLILIPWLPPRRRRSPARIDLANCNGCTRCYVDCPFSAIEMVARSDGAPFEREAKVDSELCVSCGICAGACPTSTPFRRASELSPGIDLPDFTMADLRARTLAAAKGLSGRDRILVFDCEHALDTKRLAIANAGVVRIRCAAMLPPSFLDFVLSRDLADGVVLTGCREGQCQYRLGNQWVEERLDGVRDPRLRKRVLRQRLLKFWAATTDAAAFCTAVADFKRRLGQMPAEERTKPREEELAKLAPNMRKAVVCSRERVPLVFEMAVDGRVVYAETLMPTGLRGDGPSRTYHKITTSAGLHKLNLKLRDTDRASGFDFVRDVEVELRPRQNLTIDFKAAQGGFILE